MFSFGAGKSVPLNIYAIAEVKRPPKKDTSAKAPKKTTPLPDSLKPAIDGPPSPQRIRAYTEQMKRSSIFRNNGRTDTLSSATSSFYSHDLDVVGLSRKSSSRSNASSRPSSRVDRPESVLGKSIFSRAGRKARKEASSLSNSASSLTVGENRSEERLSPKEDHYNNENSQKKHLISKPYNFQHVTHTRPDHVSKLENASKNEMVSEFSALRASQGPKNGELKGIRAQDLHFENFSSEAVNATNGEVWRSDISPQIERGVSREAPSAPQPHRYLNYARSLDNLKSSPTRPLRSPLSPTCPIALPARTSSRTASVMFDTIDPLSTATIQRPLPVNGGFRRPAPFNGPLRPPPPPPSWSEQQQDHFYDHPVPQAMTTQGHEAWPLTTPVGNFGELADVQEEEELHQSSRRSRVSTSSIKLRPSRSVPALQLRSYEQETDRAENTSSTTLVRSPSSSTLRKSPITSGFDLSDDWEKDVDYCYENEVEADFDYQWDKSIVKDSAPAEATQTASDQPLLELHLEDNRRSVYHGRFRPSLLVPSALDIPELSPLSSSSSASNPITPSNFLRSGHTRSPSHASSFKESHGFNLSPSLLIPTDMYPQINQDAFYEDHDSNHPTATSILTHEPYDHSNPPFDETNSSTASYRSFDFSRGSARSSSSTRISVAHSRLSQDSVMLLNRTVSVSKAHRSIGSASSLSDFVPSSLRHSEQVLSFDIGASAGPVEITEGDQVVQASPGPENVSLSTEINSLPPRRNKSSGTDPALRKGANHFPPSTAAMQVVEQHSSLSPVAESFNDSPRERIETKSIRHTHGRKTSAPLLQSATVKEPSGRARAATSAGAGGKTRGSYMLFPPQI